MKTILIVEDNPIISKIYQARFLKENFRVEVAENGLAAIKLLATLRPDLILLDLLMPIMHGVDVLRFVRSSPVLKSTPVVILSEAYMSDLAQEAAKIGAELTLLKSSCTPDLMLDIANKIFAGVPIELDADKMLAVRPKNSQDGR